MPSDTVTARMPAAFPRVVLVHDEMRACMPLADALRTSFGVRIAATVPEMVDQLGPLERLACVVCIPSPGVRARDVREAFIKAGGRADWLVVIDKDELVRSPHKVQETLETVRRLREPRSEWPWAGQGPGPATSTRVNISKK